MRFVRNLAFGLTLAILAIALAFAIITYGPRNYTVSHSYYAEVHSRFAHAWSGRATGPRKRQSA